MEYKDTPIYKNFGTKIGTSVLASEIPKELRNYKKFLLWREIENKKVPYSFCDGKLKAVNARDERFHLTFDNAILYTNSLFGLMFVLENTEYWCIDFDDFSNVEEVKEIVDKAGSYAEITPSGQGFRIWFRNHNPFTSRDESFKLPDGRLIEVFNNKQVTITGHRISEETKINGIPVDFVLYLKNKYIGRIDQEEKIKAGIDERTKKVLNALIERFNGKVHERYISLSCLLHLPDEHASATIYLNDGKIENMMYVCHHENISMPLVELLKKKNLMHLLYNFEENEDEKEKDFAQEIVDDWKKLPHQRKTKRFFLKEIFANSEHKYFIYAISLSGAEAPSFLLCREPKRLGVTKLVYRKKFFLSDLIKELEKGKLIYIFAAIDEVLKNKLRIKIKTKNELEELDCYQKLQEYKRLEETLGYTLFYEEIDAAKIELYKPADEQNVEELIRYGFYQRAKYDDNIEKIFKAFLINIDNENAWLARYSPHSIVVTNTKAGKSYLAKVISGRSFEGDNVSASGEHGFGVSDGMKEGALNYTKECRFYDELSTATKEKLSGMLNLLEGGESDIVKGAADFTTSYGNAIVFLSNEDMIKKEGALEVVFLKLLLNIHKNLEAVASRMGIIYYNANTKKVETPSEVPNELTEKATLIFEVLRKKISEKYVELIKNSKVYAWLEQEFPKEYVEELKEIAKAQINFQEIRTFIEKHIFAYRHVRGAALRIALFDSAILYKILHDELDIDELLKTADVYFKYICDINKTSFNILRNTTFGQFEKVTLDLMKLFDSTATDAVKIFAFTTRLYYEQYKENTIGVFDSSNFAKFYNEQIKHLFGELRYGHGFNAVYTRINTINNDYLEKLFGINILKQQDKLTIVVNDDVKLLTASFDLIELKSKQNLGELYREYKRAKNTETIEPEEIYVGTEQKNDQVESNEREIEKKLSEVAKKDYEDNRFGREWMVCDLISCFGMNEDIDFELIKKYYSMRFPDVDHVDYLIRKLREEGFIYEYRPMVYRKCYDMEVRDHDE